MRKKPKRKIITDKTTHDAGPVEDVKNGGSEILM